MPSTLSALPWSSSQIIAVLTAKGLLICEKLSPRPSWFSGQTLEGHWPGNALGSPERAGGDE